MDFPSLVPSSRQYKPGDYPVKSNMMMDGFETRILFGNKRFGATLTLQYQNIPDSAANEFLNHYNDRKGTYMGFILAEGGPSENKPKGGMDAELAINMPGQDGSLWRYAEQPGLTSVYPGVSSVSVKLVQVFT